MGISRKVATGTLAAGTLDESERADQDPGAHTDVRTHLTDEERATGILFRGTTHDKGSRAQVTLYADRIERVPERSRHSLSPPREAIELTPMNTVSSVQTRGEGFSYTKASVLAPGKPTVEFKFRNKAAGQFRDCIQELILNQDSPVELSNP